MSDTVIRVENLSKKYIIGHEKQEGYISLRDTISNNVKGLYRKTKDIISQNQQVKGVREEEFWALKDISFNINQGDRVGIIGRNGAGKSTLLKILSRITEPSEGKIRIKGRVASLLEVGTGFHPELTGRENIFLNGAILGMSRQEIKSKFDEIVAFAEVEKFLDTPVKRYSSGMYVRLAFAVAANLEPEILIIDEVLAVGDAQFQKKCLGKMEDVSKKDGRTIIFVSHHMVMINNLCDYSILLNDGKKVKEGPSSQITELYLNQFRSNDSFKFWEKNVKLNKGVWLKSLEVLNANMENKEKYLLNEDVLIKISFDILGEASSICHSIAIVNSDDIIAFISLSSSDQYYKALHNKGSYSTIGVIPKNILNTGKYWIISNIADDNHNVLLDSDKDVSFEMIDDGLDRGGYFGSWNGVFRPVLKWNTQTV